MLHNLYSVYDTASALYSQAAAEISDATAIRSFSNLATNEENPIGLHPEDYTLVRMGTFNDGTGELKNSENESLITGLEAVANSRSVDPNSITALDAHIGGTQ